MGKFVVLCALLMYFLKLCECQLFSPHQDTSVPKGNGSFPTNPFFWSPTNQFFEIQKNVSYSMLIRNIENLKTSENEACVGHLKDFAKGIYWPEPWAIRILDSWGKMPSQILHGRMFTFGGFEECLNIAEYIKNTSQLFPVQYCLTYYEQLINDRNTGPLINGSIINLPDGKSFKMYFGLCLPKSCKPEDIRVILPKLLNMEVGHIKVKDVMCSKNEVSSWKPADWVAVILLIVFIILVISSTTFDFFVPVCEDEGVYQYPFLRTFSILRNGRKLFNIERYPDDDTTGFLHGIRSLSMIWVIYNHASYMLFIAPSMDGLEAVKVIKNHFLLFSLEGHVALSTFFVMSGVLITIKLMKMLKEGKRINIPFLYIYRYLRLTPNMALCLLFIVTLLRFCGSGPLWNQFVEHAAQPCRENWWLNLLYLHNYIRNDNICFGVTWYLAADTHMFLIAPFILLALWRWKRKVLYILVILIFVSVGCNLAIYIINGFSLWEYDTENVWSKRFITLYPTHQHIPPWLSGVVLGYILHVNKDRKLVLSKLIVILGWILSIAAALSVIFSPYDLYQPHARNMVVESQIYKFFEDVLWTGSVCWIIFACYTGYGGLINSMLAHPMWKPIARLSFSMYLVHGVMMIIELGRTKAVTKYEIYELIKTFWILFGYTVSFSIIFVLVFEMPLSEICNMLLKGHRKERQNIKPATESLEKDVEEQDDAKTSPLEIKD